MTDDELGEAVFTALGEASMCWEHPDRGGVFQTERIRRVGDELIAKITGKAVIIPDPRVVFDDGYDPTTTTAGALGLTPR